jgi:monothiol glutaredoxin
MSRMVMDEIKQEVESHPVLIYMKGTREMPQCGFSAATIQVLGSYGVPIKDVNILVDQEKWAAVKTFSQWPTIPQVYIGGKFIGGCDIVREMHARGEIGPLIEQAFAAKR